MARIRDTTQLLLDVFSNEKYVYLHPLKVWNRYSDKMFLPHSCRKSTEQFATVEDGVGMSRYYQTLQKISVHSQDQNYDSHDRFFNMAKMEYSRGRFTEETENQIIRSTMTKDSRLKTLVKEYFKPDFVVNLLQCRPLYLGQEGEKVNLKTLELKEIFFDIKDSSMGSSGKRKIDVVVQIDPVLYYEYPYAKKYDVAQAIEQINQYYKGSGKNLLLMTPGRIGTSSPELKDMIQIREVEEVYYWLDTVSNRGICGKE